MEAEARAARQAEEAARLAQGQQRWLEANPEKAALLEKCKNGLPFTANALDEMFSCYDRLDEIEPENCSWLHKKADAGFPETVRCFRELTDLIRSLDDSLDEDFFKTYLYCYYGADFSHMFNYTRCSPDATYLFVDKAAEISFSSEAEETEIKEILRQYNLHPLIGRTYLTDWLTGEKYRLEDKMVGWGMVDLAATYGGVWLIREDI